MAKIEKLEMNSSRRIDPLINRRFLMVAEKLNEIVDAINGDTAHEVVEAGEVVAETVSDAPIIEDQPITVDAAQDFNYLECTDKQELEDYGRSLNPPIELDKRAKAETMQKRITEHLGVAE